MGMVQTSRVRGQLPRDCDCFLQSNFFVSKMGNMTRDVHFSFEDVPKKSSLVCMKLESEGYPKSTALMIADTICAEYDRRLKLDEEHTARKLRHAKKINKDFMTIANFENGINSELLTAIKENDGKRLRALAQEISPGRIYSIQIFQPDFCSYIVQKLTEYKQKVGDDRSRPNSMNSQGVLLDEIPGATESLSNPLVEYIIAPLARHLLLPYKDEEEIFILDNHRCFSVEYDQFKEPQLALHFDNAEITLNIHLAGSYSGGVIELCGDKRLAEEDHSTKISVPNNQIGRAILHFGNELHRALPIKPPQHSSLCNDEDDDSNCAPAHTSRTNLIIW
eukprot:CAMPEP_0197286002 /NCGR_PEP_ID=MMETSP0890-20130614/1380_1 /TAXON_ID=44058 ORGANISM="Aureoumbra lagunensis, Strain CCMP1510" /NCGR_SAMPLE_ID=MMETSP0890 /ASSEMBLY_ACC=CAM_ASM_000533 /LENGTH=334 /DNA_ID=CAMNT_0042753971 /DNA_START=24 /DNA_END=1025 /DNA_ORIENTATION=+